MRKYILIIGLIFLFISIAGCSKSNTSENNNQPVSSVTNSVELTMIDSQTVSSGTMSVESTASDSQSVSDGNNAVKSTVLENHYKSGSDDKNTVELHKINDRLWVHISYTDYNGTRTGSNGLVALSSEGIVLIDTPWNNAQTKELLSLVEKVFNKKVKQAIITHAHADRIGGIDTLLENNIDVYSTAKTMEEAQKNGFQKPRIKLDNNMKFTFGDLSYETFYPGAGHSPDNITIWFPKDKLLFGGCLIKSMESTDKGSTESADLKQWPLSVKKVIDKYPDAQVIIPGHGKWGGIELLDHTLELVKK
jgi:metallo-beta-lactamase class B